MVDLSYLDGYSEDGDDVGIKIPEEPLKPIEQETSYLEEYDEELKEEPEAVDEQEEAYPPANTVSRFSAVGMSKSRHSSQQHPSGLPTRYARQTPMTIAINANTTHWATVLRTVAKRRRGCARAQRRC